MEPIAVSPKTISRQARLLHNRWPKKNPPKLMTARQWLCYLYGFDSDHQFQRSVLQKKGTTGRVPTQELITASYPDLVKRLESVSGLEGHMAKHVIAELWPVYLRPHFKGWRQHQAKFTFDHALCHFLKIPGTPEVTYRFDGIPSLKDAIEAQGVPHPEIALIVMDSSPVPMDNLIEPDRHYQIFAAGQTIKGIKLVPAMPEHPRFVLDVHLGKLARHLRVLGFDTFYSTSIVDDEALASISHRENRILLTRDKGLLKHKKVDYGHWIQQTDANAQCKELIQYYALGNHAAPFTRCVRCNGVLNTVSKEAVLSKLPENVAQSQTLFRQCQDCHQVYWRGSHYDKITRWLEQMLSD